MPGGKLRLVAVKFPGIKDLSAKPYISRPAIQNQNQGGQRGTVTQMISEMSQGCGGPWQDGHVIAGRQIGEQAQFLGQIFVYDQKMPGRAGLWRLGLVRVCVMHSVDLAQYGAAELTL